MLSVHSPDKNNLLRLLHIQREIVVTAPPGQVAHLAPVVCLISVVDETHHSRVIRKFNEEVGVVWRCAVVGQQSEEEGAQHTSLGGPCVQCDGAGCVYYRPVLPEVSRSESPTAKCTATYWAPAGPIYEWAVEGWLCWMLNWSLWTAFWHTSLFCPDVWVLGGGQWRWHHRSSGWTYMQTGKGPGRGGGQTWCGAWLAVQSTSWE